jgi:hypothetical protein
MRWLLSVKAEYRNSRIALGRMVVEKSACLRAILERPNVVHFSILPRKKKCPSEKKIDANDVRAYA